VLGQHGMLSSFCLASHLHILGRARVTVLLLSCLCASDEACCCQMLVRSMVGANLQLN
jgi:hypothetical protein